MIAAAAPITTATASDVPNAMPYARATAGAADDGVRDRNRDRRREVELQRRRRHAHLPQHAGRVVVAGEHEVGDAVAGALEVEVADPIVARPSRKSSIPNSTSRTNVNTPSTNSVGSATSAKTLNTVPPLATCAVRPRPTSVLDTLPRNSAERDALSDAACERAPASPSARWARGEPLGVSAIYRYSTTRPA